ncbi:MAG: hypothetical protein HRT88_20270, partial [Lentisphaeraceae bacterium]|nr:hypothetical protein [Lentisphaeraceae bacterium]
GLAQSQDHPASETPRSLEQLSNKGVEHEGMICGTPGFMAPEQALGNNQNICTQTDIYSLGAILYALITLSAPCEADTLEKTIDNTIHGKFKMPSLLADTPETLELICLKCLGFNNQARYESVEKLSHDLQQWLKGYAISLENPGLFLQLKLFYARQKRLVWSSFTVLIIFLITVSAFLSALYNSAEEQKTAKQDIQVLYDDLTDSQGKQKKLSAQVAQQVYSQAVKNYKTRDFEKASQFALYTTKLDPGFKLASELLIKSLLLTRKFTKALNIIESTHNDDKQLRELVKLCIQRPPVKFPDSCNRLWAYFYENGDPYALTGIYRWLQNYPLLQRIKFAEKYLSKINHAPISIKFSIQKRKLFIDLSNQQGLTDLSPLTILPKMYSLDLSGSKNLKSLKSLMVKYLKELSLYHCPAIRDFKALRGMKLTYLNLEGTYIRDLTVLKSMPLKELELGVLTLNLIPINTCPQLKKITIPQGRYPEDGPRGLREGISVYLRGKPSKKIR